MSDFRYWVERIAGIVWFGAIISVGVLVITASWYAIASLARTP